MQRSNYLKRESFYQHRQLEMEDIATKNFSRAMQNEDFAEKLRTWQSLSFTIVKLDLFGRDEESLFYKRLQDKYASEIRAILNTMNLSFEDFHPKRICEKCMDTGWTEDGKMCDCYHD